MLDSLDPRIHKRALVNTGIVTWIPVKFGEFLNYLGNLCILKTSTMFHSPIVISLSLTAVHIPSFQVFRDGLAFCFHSGFQLIMIFGSRVGSILHSILHRLNLFSCRSLSGFSTKICYAYSVSSMHTRCPTNLIFLYLFIMVGVFCSNPRTSCCRSLPQSRVTNARAKCLFSKHTTNAPS